MHILDSDMCGQVAFGNVPLDPVTSTGNASLNEDGLPDRKLSLAKPLGCTRSAGREGSRYLPGPPPCLLQAPYLHGRCPKTLSEGSQVQTLGPLMALDMPPWLLTTGGC